MFVSPATRQKGPFSVYSTVLMNRQGFINVALVFIVAAFSGAATYYAMTGEVKAPLQNEAQEAGLETSSSSVAINCNSDLPFITGLSVSSGTIGTKLEIFGCNFAGFEGDKTVWIENEEGRKGILYGEPSSTDEIIRTTLQSPLCEKDNSYSGEECDIFLTLTSGTYKIFVYPWGKKSNEVSFIIK